MCHTNLFSSQPLHMGNSESTSKVFFKINAKYVRAACSIQTHAIYYTLSSSKPDSSCLIKKSFCLSGKPHMHRVLHLLVTGKLTAFCSTWERTKQMIIRMRHIRATWRVFRNLKVQMLVGFNSPGASVCGNPMLCNNQTHFNTSPQHLFSTAGFRLSLSIS
jgi:hypothetical protein